MARIGFIGLGRMGLPMARNLMKTGHDLKAFDVADGPVATLAGEGATRTASAGEVAKGVDCLITMLPEGRHTLDVYGRSGVLDAASVGTLIIDCSSIDLESARQAHTLAADAGFAMLDAPVSGGVGGAVGGTLTFMCGGSADAFARASPILQGMGRRIVYCGAAGAGQAVKMCNQIMAATSMAIAAEALVLAERLGIDPKIFHEVITASSGGSWIMQNYPPVAGLAPNAAANNAFAPGFTTALMLKDVKIFEAAAQAAGVPSPVGAAATQLYQILHDQGAAGLDYSSVIELLRGRASRTPAAETRP
jgi:3-hydroxyisobutyrate dehydrogenase